MGFCSRKTQSSILARILATLILAGLAVSCSRASAEGQPSVSTTNAPSPAGVAARFGTATITLAELDEVAAPQIFDLRAAALRKLLVGKLVRQEAKRRNIDVMKLRDVEIEGKVALPSHAEAEATLAEWVKQGRLLPEEAAQMTLAQMAERLRGIRLREREEAYYDELFRKESVTIDFAALGKPELNISGDGPALGPDKPTLTIVEFSDLTVSYTALWQPTLERLVDKYGGQVRFLFKLKLEHGTPDSLAAKVAQAALCANDQGKYWEFRRALFAQGSPVTLEIATIAATKTQLDLKSFDACVSTGKNQDRVERDSREARANGLMGDPVVVVSGIRLSGAQSFDTVDRLLRIEMGTI